MATTASVKQRVLNAAKDLFMAKGYEQVGMREIAKAVGRQPVQVYRLNLGKSDILAELVIELNQQQITQLPALLKGVEGTDAFERTCSYLMQLYRLDIQYLPIRSVGAAFGWLWSLDHERRVTEQVGQLVQPVADWLQEAGLDQVPARIMGIWSLYYVGYRRAVMGGATAEECLSAIAPSLRLLLRMGPRDINPPEAAAEVAGTFAKLAREGGATFHTQHVRKDGSSLPVEIYSRRIALGGGQIILSTARDISERIRAEEALAQLAAIVAFSSDAVLSESMAGRILTWNSAAGRLFGYAAEEAIGCPASILIPADRRQEEEEILDHIRHGIRVKPFETVRVRKDGSLVDVSIMVSPIKDTTGRVVSASRIIQDITARKLAETVLRTSEEKFNKTFQGAPVLITLSRLKDGTLLEVNERFCLISGFRREEVIGRTAVELGWVGLEDRDRMVGLLAASGRVQDQELTHRRKDGCPVYTLYSGEVIQMAGEEVLVAMAIDITRRRMAEQLLQESERKYRLLADNATDVIWLLDLKTSSFLYVSPSVERLRGFTPEEVMAQTVEASVTPASLASIRLEVPEHLKAFQAGAREVYLSEVEQPRKDGSTVWTECTTQYSVNPDTGHPLVFGISRDITKRRQAEGALRISEERYRRVAENLAEGLGVTSAAGRYTYCNNRFAEMFGFSQEELLRMTPLDLVPAAARESVSRRLIERSHGRADRYEQKLERKDGTLIDCLLAVSPLMDDAGSYQGSLALITDITDKKVIEQAMRKAEKSEALGEMAAGLAHDFNNLFQSLLMHLELARDRLDPGTPEGNHITKASAILFRAAVLSQQILQFTGASLRDAQKLAFIPWLKAQEAALAATLRTTGPFELKLDVPTGDGWVTGDPDQLFSVLKALILNAGEAMAPQLEEGQGPVWISVKALHDPSELPERMYWAEPPGQFPGYCLTVEDHGQGLPPGHEQRIFDPFHSTKAPGRGLGLAAAFGIIRAHGGGIGIGSGPGGTTVAAIFLPSTLTGAVLPDPSAGAGTPSRPPEVPPKAILLVDDDASLLEVMSECLELLGYPVLMARDGLEALGVFKEHRSEIALVILDAQMPRMGGVEAFRNLRALDPELKVILCTGFGEEFGRSTAAEHGFTGLLGKPVRIDQLKRTLEAILLEVPEP